MFVASATLRRTLLRGLQGAALLGLLLALAPARADLGPAPATPRANYKQARKYGKKALESLTYSTAVNPGWIGKTDLFWYSYRTSKGTNYWLVDPAKKTKVALFDKEKLGGQLAELSRKPIDAAELKLQRGRVSDDAAKFTFVFDDKLYEYDLKGEKLTSKGKAPAEPRFPGDGPPGKGFGKRRIAEDEPQEKVIDKTKGPDDKGKARAGRAPSPDRKFTLFTKDNNLYLADAGKEKDAVQLTRDGAENYGFNLGQGFGGFGGGGVRGRGGPGLAPRATTWSKDSKHFHVTRMDGRGVKELWVINSLANPRPTLEKYSYPMPGEEAVRKTELHVGSAATKSLLRVPPRWRDESYSDLRWGKAPNELRFVRRDRLARNLDYCSLDCATGELRTLISEGFENAPVDFQQPHYLEETDEMVWWSERTGWGHYYLYERSGKLKHAITSGSWRASRVVAVDEKKRLLYFQGNGREPGENVYYPHLYCASLDGGELTLLDPGDANHFSTLSPTRRYLVDNTSRVDKAPDSALRDATGHKVLDLEKADFSRLQEYGWRPPETFSVKALDGVTDLYGNLWKPFDFDPKRKYPVIAHVYPGPQTEGVTHTFSAYSTNMQLAQLGFIVIQVGHRGGTPNRSKAYASFGYFNLRDYALADKKAAIEQLAARHPWIDLGKVGIYGHSGGGFMSAAAMLQKPYNEFFKAAVASAGNHDNNIYNNFWSERYHGMKEVAIKEESKERERAKAPEDEPAAPPPVRAKAAVKAEAKPPAKTTAPVAPLPKTKFEIKVPTNAELAANLKGRLLLVHGEIDNNVHPANTMRLVDALIKANKRFDLLIIPGQRHGFGSATGYFNQRMWEFFAEALLGDRREGADLGEGEPAEGGAPGATAP